MIALFNRLLLNLTSSFAQAPTPTSNDSFVAPTKDDYSKVCFDSFNLSRSCIIKFLAYRSNQCHTRFSASWIACGRSATRSKASKPFKVLSSSHNSRK